MNPPTAKQRAVYDYIASYLRSKGYAPSIREIAKNVIGSRHPTTAWQQVKALEAKGWLRVEAKRGIRLKGDAGEFAALTRTIEDSRGVVKVLDDSLEHEHIKKGDYVVMGPKQKQLAVVRIVA
jgi:SOS-response transcriptional repressor LexA